MEETNNPLIKKNSKNKEPTNNEPTKLKANDIKLQINSIKSSIIDELENKKKSTSLQNNVTFFNDYNASIVSQVNKELKTIYEKATNSFQSIEDYYKQTKDKDFKAELKTLLIDTNAPSVKKLLDLKQIQEAKIKQATAMIDLIQFQIDKQDFNRLALETMKKEAEKRNVSVEPPSLKRLNSDNSTNEQKDVKTKKARKTKDKKTEEKSKEPEEKPEEKPITAASGKKPRLNVVDSMNSKRLAQNPNANLVDDFMLSLEQIE